MHRIKLQQTLPEVFADCISTSSDIWNKDVVFEKGMSYLLEADSGTGKSSLCSFIYGYRKDYRGSISFDATDINSLSMHKWVDLRKNSISLLFQELRLFPELTAWENIELKNNLTGYKSKDEITALFEQLHIAGKLNTKAGKLSFGQQQRVAFIRTLCQPYDFIILDEPVSHLDDTNSAIMAEILATEVSRLHAGVIVTSIGKHIELNYNHVLKL